MIEPGYQRRRFNYHFLLALVAACVLFIVAKLFSMQVFSSGFYRKASEQNGVRMVPIPAPRGMIFDKKGTLLVKSRPSYSMYILPYEVDNLDSTCSRLAEVMKQDTEEIKNRIKIGWQGHYRPIRLKRDVDFPTVSFIEEHALDFPGIAFEVEPTRQYPENNYGAHLWGYVGEITDDELVRDSLSGYFMGDIIGKDGIEKQYEEFLRGTSGLKYLEVTAAGKILGELKDRPRINPIRGSTLNMEIDWDLQTLAEEELTARGSGAIVAIDPRNGAVRILASVPDYDPNLFSGVISQDIWNQVSSDSLHPLFDRAIKGTYPPGSTMKAVTAAMGLEDHIITPSTRFDPCHGAKQFGNRVFKCWTPRGHGSLGLIDAIIQSCDVYFYQLGLAGGIAAWTEMSGKLHFGQVTGIDMPGELPGINPTPEYMDRRYGDRGWTKFLVINLAIGQGEILVTPVQMAAFYAAIGNGGTLYKPRLVSTIISPAGDTMYNEPEIIEKLPISQENLGYIKTGLAGVVNDPRGTAHQAAVKGFIVAGKTGTAQNPHGNDHAWFVCYAPAESPEIAIAVLVENAGHGGSMAAPVAGKILQRFFGVDTTATVASAQIPGRQ